MITQHRCFIMSSTTKMLVMVITSLIAALHSLDAVSLNGTVSPSTLHHQMSPYHQMSLYHQNGTALPMAAVSPLDATLSNGTMLSNDAASWNTTLSSTPAVPLLDTVLQQIINAQYYITVTYKIQFECEIWVIDMLRWVKLALLHTQLASPYLASWLSLCILILYSKTYWYKLLIMSVKVYINSS